MSDVSPDESAIGPSVRLSAADAARAYCERFAARDLEALLALFQPDGVCDVPLWPQPASGLAQLRDALGRATGSLASCEIDIATMIEDGSRACTEGHLRAKRHDGAELDFPFAMIVEMENGLIARATEYFDCAPIFAGRRP